MRADRLLAIMMVLQRRGKMTTQALAKELHVSRRTILRDVDVLSSAGIPLYTEGGRGGGVALDENYRVSLTGLKEAEVRSLFIASSSRLLSDIGLAEAAESTLPKLFAALPVRHQETVEHLRQRIYIDPVWWWHDDALLPFWTQLQTAVYEDRYIWVHYEHYDGEIVERVLAPYGLVAKASLWYLIAWRDGQFRTYRVGRFHEVTVLDTRFERQSDFDLATYWQGHIPQFIVSLTQYTFTLRIDSNRWSFAMWHTPGRSEILNGPGEDGWVTARFQVESSEVARMFVFGLGTGAVIVEPLELRDSVVDLARAMLAHYVTPAIHTLR